MLKRTLVAAIFMSSIGAALAAGPQLPAFLKTATEGGQLQVLRDFKAAGGFNGWVVREARTNATTVIFSTADGNYTFSGMLLDKEGQNLTAKYAEQYVPKPDHTPAFKAFSAGGEATGVTVGSEAAKAEIIVLFDVNCGYCKLMHKLVKPAVDAGELRVRYVPVAILGADSDVKGAGLLASKEPKALLDSLAAGGTADYSNDKTLLGKVKSSSALMQKFGFNGTPVVMYKTKSGSDETITVSPGLPSMLEMFKGLGISGQVDALKADPGLAKYLR